MIALRYLPVIALVALIGCSSTGQRTSVNVGYYEVKGTTYKQLDQNIALHGPTVPGVGKAVAATNIRMVPNIGFNETSLGCEVSRANVKVIANVTLPRLSDRKKAKRSLRTAFSNIERYARDHEAVHVAIADEFAGKAEKAISALPAEKSCETLRAKATAIFESLMIKHRTAQLKFDADENLRFAKARQENA